MSEKYKFVDPKGLYFVTSTVVFWIDLFTRKEYRYLLIEGLKYYQVKRGLVIHAWCIMPSHIHLIISSDADLSAIIRDFKKLLSKRIVEEIRIINESRKEWLLKAFVKAGVDLKRITNNKLWQDGNHPILLDSAEMVSQKVDYIHHNPVKDEIVDEPEFYWYSSARDYTGKKGLLDVELLC
jgi:REP element-mobilizing transposase RayT